MEDLLKLFGLSDHPLVMLLGAVCLAIIAIASFSDSVQKLLKLNSIIRDKFPDSARSWNLSRRNFVLGGAVLGGLAAFGYLRNSYSKAKGFYSFTSKLSASGYLIANRKTGVIHHSKICKWHLPDEVNQATDFKKLVNPKPHNFKNLNIYEVAGKQFYSEKRYDAAIVYFKKAIELSPERVHLYDFVARIYGRQKKYKDIRLLYENGLHKLEASIPLSDKRRQLQKAERDLQSRLDRILQKYWL